ncbi:MAG TPA: substrate-binding domain-containing protein [Bryobacteraceae bacterium]|jgi:molybdate transport system substrate-binding protein|nr:substrate-binding domain-containing protein [Bryobacteraceae bacterium]
MKIRSVAAVIFGAASLLAQPASIRVLVSNGVRAVVEDLQPQCEKTIGHPLAIEYSAAALLKQNVDAGEQFDVAFLTTEVTDELIKEGKVTAESRVDLGRVGVGIGIRAGAPKPDISSPDALKRTLLNAKSITYAKDGAARKLIEKIYDRLGITNEVQPKIMLQSVPGRPQTAVADGQAEMVMTLISEILPVKGVELVGPVPKELQSYVSFRGGVSAHTKNAEASRAVVKFFTSSKAAAAYRARGLEPAR